MLTLTSAGSVGTLPARGGLFGLLAFSAVGWYWQFSPRPAGAANCGNAPGAGGPALVVGVLAAAALSSLSEPRVVTTTVTMAAISTIAPTAEPMIIKRRRLRSFSARRSSCRSSFRFAVARRCSLVGTAGVLLECGSVGNECARRC
jgi:hypothetical protein